MSCTSSESEQHPRVAPKMKSRIPQKRRVAPPRDYEGESLAEKLSTLLSASESEMNSDSEDHLEVDEEDIFELDENGCVQDFNLIADALEHRKSENKTFNEFELRDIERKNNILMNKILSNNRRPSQYKVAPPIGNKVSSSSINRRHKQTEIDRENMILLKKIQAVKPFGLSKKK